MLLQELTSRAQLLLEQNRQLTADKSQADERMNELLAKEKDLTDKCREQVYASRTLSHGR